jgi:lysozyme
MTDDDLVLLRLLILKHEGEVKRNGRHVVYDDKTAQPIIAGSKVIGNPTIGHGRNLVSPGLSDSEVKVLDDNVVAEALHELDRYLSWFSTLNPPRQAVLIDMCINMGWPEMSAFKDFFALMARGSYHAAAEDLAKTRWFSENHGGSRDSRAAHAYAMLLTGEWPADIQPKGDSA